MKKNKVDKNLDAPNASWTFKGNVSKAFLIMLKNQFHSIKKVMS